MNQKASQNVTLAVSVMEDTDRAEVPGGREDRVYPAVYHYSD